MVVGILRVVVMVVVHLIVHVVRIVVQVAPAAQVVRGAGTKAAGLQLTMELPLGVSA